MSWCANCLEQHSGETGALLAAVEERRRRDDAKGSVWERHRRGEFDWFVQQGVATCSGIRLGHARCLELRGDDNSDWSRWRAEERRHRWFASWWSICQTCTRELNEAYLKQRAVLREATPARLWPLVSRAEMLWTAGELPRALWALAEAEAAVEAANSLFALLMEDRVHDAIAAFAGGEMPVVHLPERLGRTFKLLQEIKEAKPLKGKRKPRAPAGPGDWARDQARRNRMEAWRMWNRANDGLNAETAVIRWQTEREALRTLSYKTAASPNVRRARAVADLRHTLARARGYSGDGP